MNNYTVFHLHTDLSNAFTSMDSVNKYKHYVDRAVQLGMKSIAFSEHGNVMEWLHKKEYVEKNGMKYIHGVEAYVTESIQEKIRDNYHVGLYAMNFDGVKEINNLMSHKVAFNRSDGHYRYNPRITFDELINTSDNIIVTTACIGGILYKGSEELKDKFIDFLIKNKHRCFLEIQHHDVNEQIEYNKYLLNLNQKHSIPLIAGTDTHSLNYDYTIGREILQARKNIHFDNEDGWDITFKSYEELVELYKNQNSMNECYYLEAINNTNTFSNMIEEFDVDRSFKYPKLSDNSDKELKDKITKGYIEKKIGEKHNSKEYNDRIKKELYVYEKQGMFDFLLLEENIKRNMRNEGRYCGYSRGSVSGSLIAYLLGITDIDSVEYNLYFERFSHLEKYSLGDIDSDWSPMDRGRVKEYLYKDIKVQFPKLHTSEIVTFNTIALKGAVKDVTGGIRSLNEKGKLDTINFPKSEVISLEEADSISKNIEDREQHYREKYPETFKYVDMLRGVIVSVGSHPSATIVSPDSINENMGTFTLTTNEYPISQLNMKEVDSLNYVKLDILGLDNVGIINNACKKAGIDRLSPDNMDFTDDKVWDNMIKDPTSIFQFESNSSHNVLKQILSESTLKKIQEVTGDVDKLSLMSMANGAIRPSGASFRNDLMAGNFKDCGHEKLDKLFEKTLGQMVYQEQILSFLNEFCGYSLGKADMVRRGFSKKLGTEQFIPDIKSGFIDTMVNKYESSVELAEKLIEDYIQIIRDSSDYGFSENHSQPYSMIGYATAYLRTYYPLEFITSVLEINESKLDKTSSVLNYMKNHTDISISPARFRKSKGGYMSDKESNVIYKGVGSVKSLNSDIGDKLYEMRHMELNNFFEFLEVSPLNKTQTEALIRIDYFCEFGKSKKLMIFYEVYRKWINKKTIKKDKLSEVPFDINLIKENSKETDKQFSKIDFKPILFEYFTSMEDEDFSICDKIEFQKEYLGYINLILDTDPDNCVILNVIKNKKYPKAHPKLDLISLGTGKRFEAKVNNRYLDLSEATEGSIIKIGSGCHKPIKYKDDETGEWKVVEGKRQYWVTNFSRIPENML